MSPPFPGGVLMCPRQPHEIIERLALIARDQLLHHADAVLLSVGLRDPVRGHLRFGPAEHGRQLGLGAERISRIIGTGLVHPMAVFLRLVDAGEHRVFLEPTAGRCRNENLTQSDRRRQSFGGATN
jgi:hypothetical protein